MSKDREWAFELDYQGPMFVKLIDTNQHWLVVMVVIDRDTSECRLVCFRDGVRKTFSPTEVEA